MGMQRSAVESARASVLPGLREKALNEIIDEKLKVQEGKRLTIVVTPAEVDKAFKEMAERNKTTEEKFMEQLKAQGIHPDTMKARTRAAMVWRDVIRRKFGNQISITDREIENFIQQSPTEGARQRSRCNSTGSRSPCPARSTRRRWRVGSARLSACAVASVAAIPPRISPKACRTPNSKASPTKPPRPSASRPAACC